MAKKSNRRGAQSQAAGREPAPGAGSGAREAAAVVAAAVALLIAYGAVFLRLYPSSRGGLGHDYFYFLPQLLAGAYWAHGNGFFSVPWFTPAFCAGVPLFPNPQSVYFSLAQLFTQFTDPLTSVRLTVLTFAATGFAGFYLLLARAFSTSRAAAVLGGALFMWNGFFTYRLAIGHFTFHAFALVPLIAFLALRAPPQGPPRELWWRAAFDVCAAGVLLGYMVLSGMINALVPAVLCIVALGLVHHVLHGGLLRFAARLAAAGAVGIALCAAKLSAAAAFLSHFSREGYKLPGASSVVGGLGVLFESLFLGPAHERVKTVFTNTEWALDRHEFEYGVTVVPLLLLVAWAVVAVRDRGALRRPSGAQLAGLAALALILALPVALNLYTPAWNALLKQVSLFKSSSSLVRWYCIEIPAVVLGAALAVDRIVSAPRLRLGLASAGVVVCVLVNVFTDRDYYEKQPYNPGRVVSAWKQLEGGTGAPPAILRVEQAPNDALATSVSSFPCYEPVFGYRLESLPIKTLHPGPVLEAAGGVLNLKNPACYVFGEANACAPGDHFAAADMARAEAFAAYRPFGFQLPAAQSAADTVNLLAAVAVGLFLLAYAARRALALRRPRGPG